jgi:hypothetical protein
MRTVIVHYHLFKNAGSTVDHILERAFGNRWVTYDTSDPAGRIGRKELAEYIEAHPDLQAISSHHAMPLVPAIEGLIVLPIILLRHPLDRARSVYDFERRQGRGLGPKSKGADHASRLSFVDYLRWRFDSGKNGVVHNFQTAWLCSSMRNVMRTRIREVDFEVAKRVIETLPAFGLVERFDESLSSFRDVFLGWGIGLNIEYSATNVSPDREATLEARLERTQQLLGKAMWDELLERNAWDIRLHKFAQRLFSERHGKNSASLNRDVISMPRAGAAR